MDVVQPTEEDL